MTGFAGGNFVGIFIPLPTNGENVHTIILLESPNYRDFQVGKGVGIFVVFP